MKFILLVCLGFLMSCSSQWSKEKMKRSLKKPRITLSQFKPIKLTKQSIKQELSSVKNMAILKKLSANGTLTVIAVTTWRTMALIMNQQVLGLTEQERLPKLSFHIYLRLFIWHNFGMDVPKDVEEEQALDPLLNPIEHGTNHKRRPYR